MTTKHIRALLEQALEAIVELEYASTAVADKKARDAKQALRAELAKPVERADPVAFMWQHEETGRTGFIEASLAKDWAKLNPRQPLVMPVYKHPPTPAWHDAPTEPGLWINSINHYAELVSQHWIDRGVVANSHARWYGPISPDTGNKS